METDTQTYALVTDVSSVYAEKRTWSQKTISVECNQKCRDTEVCELKSGGSVSCTISECAAPPSVSNANVLGNMLQVGARVVYVCDNPSVSDVDVIQPASVCQEDGTWSTVNIACRNPDCTALLAPGNCSVTTTGIQYSDKTTYICDRGYNVDTGDAVRTCREGGIWNGTEPTCTVHWKKTNQIHVTNGMKFGDWGQPEYCEFGTYAYGYDMKIEPSVGAQDDTALNAIKLYCRGLDGTESTGAITSATQKFGVWQGVIDCGPNHFLTQFALQVEGSRGGGDDSAANFVKFKCRDYQATAEPYVKAIVLGLEYGNWGSFGYWSGECGPFRAICGLRTRVETYQGVTKDDSALNDVKMFCCS